MTFHKIALIGYTGALGAHILEALLIHFPASSITLLTRQPRPSHSSLPSSINFTTVPSYTDRDTVLPALRGHDVLISTLTTTALNQEPALVDLCIEAGVRRFIPSEFSKDVLEPSYKEQSKTPLAVQRVTWAERLASLGKGRHQTEAARALPL